MVSGHIRELAARRLSRRGLLQGMAAFPLLSLAQGCATGAIDAAAGPGFAPVPASKADAVIVPPGYQARPLIAWGDALFDSASAPFDPDLLTRAEQEQRFGQNNDMLAVFADAYAFPPPRDQDRAILCANHEYADAELMFPSLAALDDFASVHANAMYAAVGVSVVQLERTNGAWRIVRDARPGAGRNRRITPFTPVVFEGPAARHPWIEEAGAFFNAAEPGRPHEPNPEGAVRCGTLANCAGGTTPWGTYLTSEENFGGFFHTSATDTPALAARAQDPAFMRDAASMGYSAARARPGLGAPRQYDIAQNPAGPSLYGWIVEIDPYDPDWAPRKRTAIGRKKGEAAATALTRDGRIVVYSGDDQANEFVYKFVSAGRFDPTNRIVNRDLLNEGQLYVAQFHEEGGRWLALTVEAANAAAIAAGSANRFADEGDLMVRVREAARLMGATPMDRPEDVEAVRDDAWIGQGPVLVACTNNAAPAAARPGNPRRQGAAAQANIAGHIVRIDEAGGDCGATSFSWDIFAMGGDPAADAPNPDDPAALLSVAYAGAAANRGDRFACPDNLCIDSALNVWITTDGSDSVFEDCNDCVMAAALGGQGPREVKRFLTGPVGAEICGPVFAPDERAFFCAIQHPGEHDAKGEDYAPQRWKTGVRPPSSFPDGNGAWPRSAVMVITRADGGRIGA